MHSVVEQWNWILFEHFIPKAWASLLSILTANFSVDVFSAWPRPQPTATYGESNYWISLPETLLNVVLNEGLSVWPATHQSGFYDLEHIFLARSSTDAAAIKALSAVGLKICVPPTHIFDMVASRDRWQYRILSPETASRALKVCTKLLTRPPSLTSTTTSLETSDTSRHSTIAPSQSQATSAPSSSTSSRATTSITS